MRKLSSYLEEFRKLHDYSEITGFRSSVLGLGVYISILKALNAFLCIFTLFLGECSVDIHLNCLTEEISR